MFEWITGVVERLGYAGVGLLTFLENLFPPIPSEVVIPLAGFVAAQGGLGVAGVIAAGSIGSIAGAWFWYEIGRRVGEQRLRRWVDRHGRWLTLSSRDVDRAQAWFRRHGSTAVFVGRLVPGIRTFVSLPAGFSGMPLAPFLIYSTAGTVIWTAGLAWAGVLLEANFTLVSDYIDLAANALLVGLGAMLAWRYVTCWTGSRPVCAD
jgi:membrane protein DedA with SNARE-associated domain